MNEITIKGDVSNKMKRVFMMSHIAPNKAVAFIHKFDIFSFFFLGIS